MVHDDSAMPTKRGSTLTHRRRLNLLAIMLTVAGCTGNAAPSTPGSPPASTEVSAAPSLAAAPSPSPTPSTIPSPAASLNPFLVPGYLDSLAAEAGLPTRVAGQALKFFGADPIPDGWPTTGVAMALGLTKSDVYLWVDAADSSDPVNALGTMHVVAIGFHGARAAALLDAFVAEAKTSPQSLCPKCVFTRKTIAGKIIVVEAGMPATRQPNGKAAFPGGRQYAYAHGNILYVIAAANASVLADLVSSLP